MAGRDGWSRGVQGAHQGSHAQHRQGHGAVTPRFNRAGKIHAANRWGIRSLLRLMARHSPASQGPAPAPRLQHPSTTRLEKPIFS